MQKNADTAAPLTATTVVTQPPRVESATLFQGHNLIEIEHAGQRYQLRLTRENKLILTK